MRTSPEAGGLEDGDAGVVGAADDSGLVGSAGVGVADRVGVGVVEAEPVGGTSLHPTSPAATTNSPATSLTLRR